MKQNVLIAMKKFKLWIFNKALQYYFPVFKAEKVLTANKIGHLFLGGELVSGKQKDSLKAQARMIRNTQIWEVMTASLKQQAQRKMFVEAKDLQDVMIGKTMCYTIEVMENIIKKIEEAR